MTPAVLLSTTDLFFAARIQNVVEKLGGHVQSVATAAEWAAQLGEVPVLAIVELGPGGQGEWLHAVQYARKWTRGIPIVAFGAHVDVDAQAAAHAAGCDFVWSKNRLTQELPTLVARYLAPAEEMAGCADAPNELVRQGVALYNQGQYYRCHDALEAAWVADPRPCRQLYQGLLQFAVALHHIEQGHFTGADKMFRRAINKFQRLPPRCQGFDVAALLRHSRSLRQELLALGPERIAHFPRQLFPSLTYAGADPSAAPSSAEGGKKR